MTGAPRTFTPAEANSALDHVRPVAERMVEVSRRLRELEAEQRDVVQTIAGNGSGFAVGESRTPEYRRLVAELQRCMGELEALGVLVKDVALGLLDFPAVRDGREVLLCWHVGEERVTSWHGVDEGFAGRKPVDWGERGDT